jgi:uncharacterized protein
MSVLDIPPSSLPSLVFPSVRIATGFWGRFRGLMGTTCLPETEALFLTHCRSVHTCFMRYTLDLVYVDMEGRVTNTVSAIRPWRISFGERGSRHVLEMARGSILRHGIKPGDSLLAQLNRVLPRVS